MSYYRQVLPFCPEQLNAVCIANEEEDEQAHGEILFCMCPRSACCHLLSPSLPFAMPTKARGIRQAAIPET